MLSIGKLTAGGRSERYYTQAVAKGREDYYAGHLEAPGQWAGSGWDERESDREVTESELRGLLDGRHPQTDARLRRRRSARGVMGFDLTFSAPKSVSILFGVGDRDVARAVRDAHDAAVIDALGYLERAACRSRRGVNGRREVEGRGFLAAAFRHRTSRAGDPQLHTHVVVANATQAEDGKWGALDGRLLYRHAKTAGYLYQAALRAELSGRLAVHWAPVHNGAAEIDGVPRTLIDQFSRRRVEVTQLMAERGERSRDAARVATLESRQPKTYDVPVDRLREQWRARATEHGFGQTELADALERGRDSPREHFPVSGVADELAGPAGVTRQASTFDRRSVLQEWAARHRNGAAVRRIEDLADRWLCHSDVVRLEGGREPRFSTRELLETEHRVLDQAPARRATGVAMASRDAVKEAIAARPTISAEQANLVEHLVTSGDGVQVVRSAAGTGKTFALDAARDAWQREAVHVRGCALSARAAIELRDRAAIESTTIARLLLDIRDGHGLRTNSVLIVDEAAMVGTRNLASLIDHAEQTESKVVLVGDDRQLPEIEAGGAFRALADRLGALELREIRRQHQAWDRHALNQLRDGDLRKWIDAYREQGRIKAAPNAEEIRQRLVDDWWRAIESEPAAYAVMVALRRSDVRDLNDRARERMRAAGRLGSEEILAVGRSFAAGDEVVSARNDRRLGIANGIRAKVTAVDEISRSLRIQSERRDVELPAQYLDGGGLDHAYAMTAHRLQGATVDRTYILGSDELYREWGYTALSRHRHSAHYYTLADHSQPALPGLREHDPLSARLDADLSRRQSKELANSRSKRADRPPTDDQNVLADLVNTVPSEMRRLRTDQRALEAAANQLHAALNRLQDTEDELARTGRIRRSRREELQRRCAAQQAAVDHWTHEHARLDTSVGAAKALREVWLAEHAWELDSLVRLDATADDEILDRLLAHESRSCHRAGEPSLTDAISDRGPPAHYER